MTAHLTTEQIEHLAVHAAQCDPELEHLCDLALAGDERVAEWLVRIVEQDDVLVAWMEQCSQWRRGMRRAA